MAGSLKHLTNNDGNYRGMDLIENMGDAEEAIEEMFFIIGSFRRVWEGHDTVEHFRERYYRCLRGEEPWPDWMNK